MKPLSLYDTLVRLEKRDLVAIVENRLWIRDGTDLYVSCDRIKSKKIPQEVHVNSAGKYKAEEFPRNIKWTYYKRTSKD
jgi:hypothetical protein